MEELEIILYLRLIQLFIDGTILFTGANLTIHELHIRMLAAPKCAKSATTRKEKKIKEKH